MCSAFLWSGSVDSPTKAKVAWEDVCLPKDEGGLGIRRLRDTSLVFALHLIWRLLSSGPSLWVVWTRHYLLRYSSFWDVKRSSRGSWIWNKLLKLRTTLRPFIEHQVISGNSTYFWFDNWLGFGPLLDRLGETAVRTLGIPRNALVQDVVTDTGWNLRPNRRPSIQLVISEITRRPPPQRTAGPDILLWRNQDNLSPHFRAQVTWNQIRPQGQRKAWAKVVWFSYGIPRASFITWLAVLDRLTTGSRAAIWGQALPCPLCGDSQETRDHLFFACHFSFTVWTSLGHRLVGRTITPDWSCTLESIRRSRRCKADNVLYRLMFQCTIYYLWRERNNRNHNKPPSSPLIVARIIRKTISARVLSRHNDAPEDCALLKRWRSLTEGL